jgi:hypothetical protein
LDRIPLGVTKRERNFTASFDNLRIHYPISNDLLHLWKMPSIPLFQSHHIVIHLLI